MLASSLSSAKQTNLKTLKMKLTDKLSPCLTIELDLVYFIYKYYDHRLNIYLSSDIENY